MLDETNELTNVCPLLSTVAPINRPENNCMPCLGESCKFWSESANDCLLKVFLESNITNNSEV